MNIEENFEATLWRHRWRHHHEKTFWYDLGRSFHIWGQIEAVFNISRFNISKYFKLFYWKLYRKLNIPERQPLAFWALAQILTAIYQFKIWPTLWPGDAINNIINMYLYKCSHNPMIPMHRKFNDDVFDRFFVIMKNVVISFIKEYRGPTLMPPCDVIDDIIIMKNTFNA